MDRPRVIGALPPTDRGVRYYESLIPQAGEVQDYTICGEAIVGLPLHWNGTARNGLGRSMLCTSHAHGCPGCKAGWGPRWGGYIAAYSHREHMGGMLVLRVEWAADLLAMSPALGSIRGLRVTANRMRRGRRAQVLWSHSSSAPLKPLPPPPDLGPTLVRIYGPAVLDIVPALRQGGVQ